MVTFFAIALVGFSETFLSFVFSFWDDFKIMNPFLIQSSFLVPIYYSISFVLMAILFAFFVKSIDDRFFYSGLSLFLSILIY